MGRPARRRGAGGAVAAVAAVCAVAALGVVCGGMAAGPRAVYEASGLLVDTAGAPPAACAAVECVRGANCSGSPAKRCTKFMYCAVAPAASTSASGSATGPENEGEGVCEAALPLGAACRAHADCLDVWAGAFCSPVTGVCTRARTAGEACDAAAACAYPLVCADGACADRHALAAGEACDTAAAASDPRSNGGCHLSLHCDAATARCAELPARAGAACDPAVGCALPLQCVPETRVCAAAPERNATQACATALDCAEGLVCARNGTCAERPADHAATPECRTHADCAQTSYCHCDAKTGALRCLPLPVARAETAAAFAALAACAARDPDLALARCQDELLAVQRAANASAVLDAECSRLPEDVAEAVDPLLLLVPVAIMVLILALVLVVKLGAPPEK